MKRLLITLIALVPFIASAQVQPITLGWDINKWIPSREFIDCSTGGVIQYGTNTLSYTVNGNAALVGTELKSTGSSGSYIGFPLYVTELGAGKSWTLLVGGGKANTYAIQSGYINFNQSNQATYSRDTGDNVVNVSASSTHLPSAVAVQSRDYSNSIMRMLFGTRYETAADARTLGFWSADIGRRHFSSGRYHDGSSFVYYADTVKTFGFWPHALSQDQLLYIMDHMNR